MLASVSGGGMASGQEPGSSGNECVDVCINEVMPNADGSDQGIYPQGEWVELLNTGSSSVSSCYGRKSRNWKIENPKN